MDMKHLKEKQDLGAGYAVTQLFYDNKKYFDFVAKARAMGITMPIIPGIKPLAKLTQVTQVPKTFHCDMPQELAKEAVKCTTDEEARQLGIEWAVSQCKELYANGVKDIHFYTVSAFKSMPDIPASSSNVMTKSTSERTVLLDASSFLEAQGPINTTLASGCSFLISLAVATIGVSALEILSMVSGKNFFASIAHEGQQEVRRNGTSPVATSFA